MTWTLLPAGANCTQLLSPSSPVGTQESTSHTEPLSKKPLLLSSSHLEKTQLAQGQQELLFPPGRWEN